MPKLEDQIDALFKLRLTEFTAARNTLAAQLKKRGLADEAKRVKALDKASISAWTVNQLYWTQREAFDELIATGRRFRKAQASGKMSNMREALEARREALSELSDMATDILRAGGHNPSLDTLRRITTTLEALSSYESFSDEATAGRLTNDVDPPGFDSFGSFVPSPTPRKTITETPRPRPAKTVTPVAKPADKTTPESRRREARQARIDAAKSSLKEAKQAFSAARVAIKSLEAAHRRAHATAAEAEKQKRQAEERFKKARAASDDAGQRAQNIAAELTEATEALDTATGNVRKATNDLEKAFRE